MQVIACRAVCELIAGFCANIYLLTSENYIVRTTVFDANGLKFSDNDFIFKASRCRKSKSFRIAY